jgi:hypothetical protein
MSNIPYLEQLTNDEVVTASKAANLALQVQRLSEQGGGGATLPFKSYMATLTQTGGTAPAASVGYNDLGGSIIWTRVDNGQYLGTLTNAFTLNKTFCAFSGPEWIYYLNGNSIFVSRFSNDAILVYTTGYDGGGAIGYMDGVLNNTPIEIRVYN